MFQILHPTAVLYSYYTWKALIKADKHFQVEVPVAGNSALLLYNKQQTQRRGLLALIAGWKNEDSSGGNPGTPGRLSMSRGIHTNIREKRH